MLVAHRQGVTTRGRSNMSVKRTRAGDIADQKMLRYLTNVVMERQHLPAEIAVSEAKKLQAKNLSATGRKSLHVSRKAKRKPPPRSDQSGAGGPPALPQSGKIAIGARQKRELESTDIKGAIARIDQRKRE